VDDDKAVPVPWTKWKKRQAVPGTHATYYCQGYIIGHRRKHPKYQLRTGWHLEREIAPATWTVGLGGEHRDRQFWILSSQQGRFPPRRRDVNPVLVRTASTWLTADALIRLSLHVRHPPQQALLVQRF
jgi:hypothetical protein